MEYCPICGGDAIKIKSNKKIAKKARQLFRREVAKEAQKLGKKIGNSMKPKPKYIPWPVWMFLVKLVIKTK